jgi:hypothetical protein
VGGQKGNTSYLSFFFFSFFPFFFFLFFFFSSFFLYLYKLNSLHKYFFFKTFFIYVFIIITISITVVLTMIVVKCCVAKGEQCNAQTLVAGLAAGSLSFILTMFSEPLSKSILVIASQYSCDCLTVFL